MRVSAVVPACNEEKNIRRMLASLLSQRTRNIDHVTQQIAVCHCIEAVIGKWQIERVGSRPPDSVPARSLLSDQPPQACAGCGLRWSL